MSVKKFKIDPAQAGRQVQGPFLRVNLNGDGCGLASCSCSPPNYISISNGEIGLNVELSDEQVKLLREKGRLDISF
jgi:hypothetical protein